MLSGTVTGGGDSTDASLFTTGISTIGSGLNCIAGSVVLVSTVAGEVSTATSVTTCSVGVDGESPGI